MDNGQHEQLLREVLMNLERLGGDLIEKAQWASNHGLCSEPPGTQGYNNKCNFDDGLFLCVRQVPEERGRWNHVVMGHGKEITHDQPPDRIRWKPDDREIADYARAITPWVASIIHGQERASWTCGGQPSSLRAYGKPRQRNPLRLILFAAFAGFMILYLLKTVSRNASPKSAIATMKADVAQTERPRASMEVWATLLATYPKLRGDRLQWRDISGMTYVAVPDPFWNALSSSQRRSLTNELDSILKTTTWTIVTGKYLGNGKMMLDVNHTRSVVLTGKISDAMQVAAQQLLVRAEKRPDPWSRSELSRKEAELEEVKKKAVERAIAFLENRAKPKDIEKLRGLVEAGKIDDTWELAKQQCAVVWKRDGLQLNGQQLEVWNDFGPYYGRGIGVLGRYLGLEKFRVMMENATLMGMSAPGFVAYEMARVRVPMSTILRTLRTCDSLNESLLRQIDYISKQLDDRHLRYRLWKLSSAIDDILSEKANK